MTMRDICSADGCTRDVIARQLCDRHYRRWKRNGDLVLHKTEAGVPLKWLVDIAMHFHGEDCLMWPFARTEKGYARVLFQGQMTTASRALCQMVNGPPPTPQHECAHSCGKGHEACVNQYHLRWATTVENHADKIVHGTRNTGMRHGNAILDDDVVRSIRHLAGTMTQRAIADRFNTSQSNIHRIAHGQAWSSVE